MIRHYQNEPLDYGYSVVVVIESRPSAQDEWARCVICDILLTGHSSRVNTA